MALTTGNMAIIVENACTPCKKAEKNVVSKYFCTDCNAHFCEPCLQFHMRIPLLEKHIVLKGSDIEVWSQLPYKCRTHDKSCEFYCCSHNSLCCHICVSLQHRGCSNMEYIPEKAKTICKKQEYKDMKQNTEKEINEMEHYKKLFKKKSETNQNSKERFLNSLKEQRKMINALFDSLERNTVKYMNKKFDENNKLINKASSEIDNHMQELQKLKQQLDTATPEKEVLVFICMKKGEKTLAEIKQRLSKIGASPNNDKFQLVTHPEIERFIQNLPDLGYIEDEQSIQESGSDVIPSRIEIRPREEGKICNKCGRPSDKGCYSCSTARSVFS